MALVWSWGWEINAPVTNYAASGWACGNPSRVYTDHSDSVQPLGGSGGGEKCLALGGATSYIKTPNSYFSISKGWITFYIKFESEAIQNDREFFSLSTASESITLRTNTPGVSYSSAGTEIQLCGHDGVVIENLTGTCNADTWYRISIKIVQNGADAHINKIYNNGVQVDSGNLDSETKLTLAGGEIESIKFKGCQVNNGDKIFIDHIFVYDDDTDDGSKELYIHGVKPQANGFQDSVLWTDNNGQNVNAGSGAAALAEVGDGNYLKTTTSSNELHTRYDSPGSNFFSEVVAINQISFNQGSGDLNNINTYSVIVFPHPSSGLPDILLGQLPENVLLTSSGKFVNVLINASDTTALLGAVSTNITEVANDDAPNSRKLKGFFQVDDGN